MDEWLGLHSRQYLFSLYSHSNTVVLWFCISILRCINTSPLDWIFISVSYETVFQWFLHDHESTQSRFFVCLVGCSFLGRGGLGWWNTLR